MPESSSGAITGALSGRKGGVNAGRCQRPHRRAAIRSRAREARPPRTRRAERASDGARVRRPGRARCGAAHGPLPSARRRTADAQCSGAPRERSGGRLRPLGTHRGRAQRHLRRRSARALARRKHLGQAGTRTFASRSTNSRNRGHARSLRRLQLGRTRPTKSSPSARENRRRVRVPSSRGGPLGAHTTLLSPHRERPRGVSCPIPDRAGLYRPVPPSTSRITPPRRRSRRHRIRRPNRLARLAR